MAIVGKPFTLLSDQIKDLEQRGLIISDEEEIKHYLTHVGYYRLAGYWQFLQKSRINQKFIPGISFDHVLQLYNFDRELRLLLLDAFERLEVSFRAIMINQMCPAYGVHWFTDRSLAFNAAKMDDVIDTINREFDRSKEGFLKQYDAKNEVEMLPPAWETLQILSFGTLSKIYGNIRNGIREKKIIANVYGLPKEEWLHSWMQVISVLRNYCAHHSQVCYRMFSFLPKVIRRAQLPWIKDIPEGGSLGSQQLYYQLCIVRYLLHTASPGNEFSYRLMELMVKYPGIDLERMGFGEKWDDEELWQ